MKIIDVKPKLQNALSKGNQKLIQNLKKQYIRQILQNNQPKPYSLLEKLEKRPKRGQKI